MTTITPEKTLKKCLEKLPVKEQCLTVLKLMYTCRLMDDKMSKMIRQNKGGTFHLCDNGHEMIGVMSGLALTPGKDWGLPYYRDRAFAMGIGCEMKELFGALLARDIPHHSGGRQMPEHFSHQGLRLPCQSSVVGSQFLHATGVAKGAKLAGKDEVVYVSGGDGSTSQGDFHEALNFASIHKLSVIFVIQDNGWAISVPAHEQTSGGSVADMASGYADLEVHDIDGCDYEEVSKALKSAVSRGRKGEGPSLIVAHVPRLGAHSSSDDPKKYQSIEHIEANNARDPITRFEAWLLKMGIATEEECATLKSEIFDAVELAAREADSYPKPDPKQVMNHVFKDAEVITENDETLDDSIVMVDALNHALQEEMEKDESIVVFGQDVARGKGGVFGTTRHLTEKFGEDRCYNTPLAESTIIGTAIGLAMHGKYRPVCEVQFADYLWTGINQLFNELASVHYRSNGEWECPVVVRMPCGGYIQGGPYHSQSIEGFLLHQPGLKVVLPSNASDAKRLLKAAIRDPNPVIFLEHKGLYRQRVFSARPEPTKDGILPLGKANVVREGDDVTMITWGMTTCMGDEIAAVLAKDGIHVEVIDLRTLCPLDLETLVTSVKKTGKCLIAHEAPLTCGFGAEIAAQIGVEAFEHLDAPIKRLGALNCPVPYAKGLEEAVLPSKEQITNALTELYNF